MSRRTKDARSGRDVTQAAIEPPCAVDPRRAIVSAIGALVGTGVVTLAFGSPDAQARSAVDDLEWVPMSHQALLEKRQRRPQLVQSTQAPEVSNAAAEVAAERVAVTDATQWPIAEARPSAYEEPAPLSIASTVEQANDVTPQQPRDFPAAGFVMPQQPEPVRAAAPAPTAAQTAGSEGSYVSGSSVAAKAAVRMPNIKADLQSLRGSLVTRAATRVDDDLLARRTQRDIRSQDLGYSEWLDDGSSSRVRNDVAVVPEQAVRAALRNAADAAAARSATVRQAQADWEAASADVDQVKGQRYPQVQVGGNTPSITGNSASFNQYNRPTASVAVSTLIYDWGKTSKSIASRTKSAEAAEFYYQAVSEQNAYEISSNLVELAKTRSIYVIGESYVKRMRQLVDMLDAIVKVDPGRLSELTQAKARLLQAQTSQETVEAQLRSLQLSITKLVGNEPMPMPGGTRWQLQLGSLDDAVSVVAQNPAIAQASAEAAAAKLSAQSVRADGLPKVNWVINKTTASDVFGNRQPWSTMVQLSWTPFQGGSQRAAERAALSRASSSSDKRDQLELDSEFKVRDAHREAIALATRAQMYDELSGETDLVRKQFFEQWYHLNRRTLLDVLSAESDFYSNQVGQVTTQFDSYQSILKIHLNNGTLRQWLEQV